jgi:hypothetical protein
MGAFRSFADTCTNGKVAPIPDLPGLTPELRVRPQSGQSLFRSINSGVLCTLTPPEKPVGF